MTVMDLHVVAVTSFLCIVNAYLDDVCISDSTLLEVINGRYKYHSWDSEYNGPIYYNSELDKFFHPGIWYADDSKRYSISSDITNASAISYCSIPTMADPMTPYDCYNDHGGQLRTFFGEKFMDDTAVLYKCNTTKHMTIQTINQSMLNVYIDLIVDVS